MGEQIISIFKDGRSLQYQRIETVYLVLDGPAEQE